ncbi:peptide-binding protein [Clostridium sp. Marseille-Q2269]|uniref:peptide-binding protein n=1 Tax=Clostridium sp. Marseille-Q2269 TaxID=2942205 RepID=UPI002072F651|nr:peptide-binding protein [Clostridium sp. Marseille-Q2269]
MKLRKLCIIALSATLTATIFSGCASNKEAKGTDKKAKDTIVYGINTPPTGVFNPLLSDSRYDINVNSILYLPLLNLDDKGGLVPALAEKYEVSKDQKTITYKLNPKAKWHDGKEITADDVVFTLTALANPKYTGELKDIVSKVKGAEEYNKGTAKNIVGLKAVDKNTVTVELKEVYAPSLLQISGIQPIPKHVWEKQPIEKWVESKKLLTTPVGSNAYKLKEYKEGEFVKFVAAEDFFGKKAKTKNFTLKITNPNTLQAELKNHSVDIANTQDMKKADVEAVKKEGYKITTYPDYMFQYMGFNLRNAKFQDKKVRQAFMYAIDRAAMVDKLIEGRGLAINTALLPTSWAYPKEGLNEYKYSVDKAKNLMKEAGWTEKNGSLTNNKGEKFDVTLKVPTGSKPREQSAVIIQEALKKIGVNVKIESMEFPTLMTQVVKNHEFDLYLMGNTLSADPDPKAFWSSQAVSDKKGEVGYNIVGYKNPEVDKLIDEGLSTIDRTKRAETYAKFGKIINEDVPEVFLYVQNNDIAYNKNLENFKPSTFSEFANIENWEIQE